MGEEILVSVVVPFYNVERYLSTCLESVARQTYGNLQVICVDDESTDGSADVTRRFVEADPRFSLVRVEHGGVSQARNAGLDACKGDFIMFVDSDDAVSSDIVQTLLEESLVSDADISMCDYVRFECDDELSELRSQESAPVIRCSGIDAYKRSYKGFNTQVNVIWGKLYRAELFSGIRYPKGLIHEDEFVTYQLFLRAGKVSVVDRPMVYYRQRPGSIMEQTLSQKNLVALDAFQERLESFLKTQDEELIAYAADYYIAYISWFYSDLESPEIRRQLVRRYRKAFRKYKGHLPSGLRMRRRLFLVSPALFAKMYQMAGE